MKITWFSSACVAYESKGTKILFDPWVNEGAFLGSWNHWPPIGSSKREILETKWDKIVYTHFHSDHFDQKFLSEYSKSHPDWQFEVVIVENSWKQLFGSITKMLTKNQSLRVLKSGEKLTLNSSGFSLQMFASDFCDPLMCGKSIGCSSGHPRFRSIDSYALISDNNSRVLNMNDAMNPAIFPYLKKQINKVDLVMGVFSAAGSFPQCMNSMAKEEKLVAASSFIERSLSNLTNLARVLDAKYIFPFAGQYILVGSLDTLNDTRAVIPVSEAVSRINKMEGNFLAFSLNPREQIVFEKGKIVDFGMSYSEPESVIKESYLEQYRNCKYQYQLSNGFVDELKLIELMDFSSEKIGKIYRNEKVNFNYSILFETTGKNFEWTLNFGQQLEYSEGLNQKYENFMKINLDYRLLYGCISRKQGYKGFTPMHWNQAHIGSHLTFTQSNYSSGASYLLNFLNSSER